METTITEDDRQAVLRASVARVERPEMKAALDAAAEPGRGTPKAAVNALHALRRHRDPVGAVGRPAYRAALPWVAAAIADDCLADTIEALGEAAEDPSREQLVAALDQVRADYSDVTIAVMLATVAGAQMAASDLCFEILVVDPRFGVSASLPSEGSGADPEKGPEAGDAPADTARAYRAEPDAEAQAQKEARRLRKRQEADERRKRQEAGRRAADQARRARKQGRAGPSAGAGRTGESILPAPTASAPRLTRRANLTPAQREVFDAADPWVAGVVVAWVPFDGDGPDAADEAGDPGSPVDGKDRPCVVVAGSSDLLLVRPGYSEGGVKSRDWRSVPLRHWRRAGFDRPTWVDFEMRSVPRQDVLAPRAWLDPDDWNALW